MVKNTGSAHKKQSIRPYGKVGVSRVLGRTGAGLAATLLAGSLGFVSAASTESGFWVEGGESFSVRFEGSGEDVQNSYTLRADNDSIPGGRAATLFFVDELPENYAIDMRVEVESSEIGANNVNFFLNYTDPNGVPLIDSREYRADASYREYHNLSGYIITWLRDRRYHAENPDATDYGRLRFRHCPGFNLIDERFTEVIPHIGQRFDVHIVKQGPVLGFYVDGELLMGTEMPLNLSGGHFGLRTFATELTWSNIRITPLP